MALRYNRRKKCQGLFLKGDITFNTTIANMNHYKKGNMHYPKDEMVRATAKK